MIGTTPRRAAWLIGCAVILGSCIDHEPASPTSDVSDLARMSLTARIEAGAAVATTLDIRAFYVRNDGDSVTLTVKPNTVALASSGTLRQAVQLDASECLRDADGPARGVTGCPLVVELTLRDEVGAIVDRQSVVPQTPATPGATIDVPPVSLGSVASVNLTARASTLIVDDTASVTASPRTGGGQPLQRPVTFTSSDTNIVVISAAGMLTARSIGSATIAASADGKTGTTGVSVRPWTLAEAELLRGTAMLRLSIATSGFDFSEGIYLLGGLLSDEFQSGDTFTERLEMDQRSISLANVVVASTYRRLLQARRTAQLAAAAYFNLLNTDGNIAHHAALAEAYAAIGLIELLISEHFCAGSTLNVVDPINGRSYFGQPETPTLFVRSVLSLTIAIDHATQAGGTAEAARLLFIARNLRARAHLNAGQFANAAIDAQTALSILPATTVAFLYQHSATSPNGIWAMNIQRGGYTVADREGGVGLDFATAGDPRLPSVLTSRRTFNLLLPLVTQQRWTTVDALVPVATGIESTLILAEAALRAGNPAAALASVNSVRTSSGLSPLVGTLTPEMLFRERAFSLWGTGHRLGDLRRLVRQYGRSQAEVFPTGIYPPNAAFGIDVTLPISAPGDNNPNFVGCLDRNA